MLPYNRSYSLVCAILSVIFLRVLKKKLHDQRDSNIFNLNSSLGQNRIKYLLQIPKLVGGFKPFEKY